MDKEKVFLRIKTKVKQKTKNNWKITAKTEKYV